MNTYLTKNKSDTTSKLTLFLTYSCYTRMKYLQKPGTLLCLIIDDVVIVRVG